MGSYRSSVLRCDIEEDGCPVCEFLGGSLRVDHLLSVIEVLDEKLADREAEVRLYRSKLLERE